MGGVYPLPIYFMDYFIIDEDRFFDFSMVPPMVRVVDVLGEDRIEKRADAIFRRFYRKQNYGLEFSRQWMPRITRDGLPVSEKYSHDEIVLVCFSILIAINTLVIELDDTFENIPVILPSSVFQSTTFDQQMKTAILSSFRGSVFMITHKDKYPTWKEAASIWDERTSINEEDERITERWNPFTRLLNDLRMMTS